MANCHRCGKETTNTAWGHECAECKAHYEAVLAQIRRDERLREAGPEMLELMKWWTDGSCERVEFNDDGAKTYCGKCEPCRGRALVAKIEKECEGKGHLDDSMGPSTECAECFECAPRRLSGEIPPYHPHCSCTITLCAICRGDDDELIQCGQCGASICSLNCLTEHRTTCIEDDTCGLCGEPIPLIDIAEFRRLGFLQELNRRFLHPLGLALYIAIDDETGEETLGGIWDYRDDPEGLFFGEADIKGREKEIELNWKSVEDLRQAKLKIRQNTQGKRFFTRGKPFQAHMGGGDGVQPLSWYPTPDQEPDA